MLTPKLSHTGLIKTQPKVAKPAEAQEMRVALAKNASGKGLVLSLERQQATLLKKMIKAQTVGYANDPKSKRTVLVEGGTGIRILGLDGNEIARAIPVTYKSVAFSLTNFVGMLAKSDFEGLIPHMYRDTSGKVTVGIGHLIADAGRAVALHKGTLPFSRRGGGRPVNNADVIAEYSAVKNAPGTNLLASAFLKFTSLDIAPASAHALALIAATKRFNEFLHSNRHPAFDTYPIEAQMVIIDMVYNLGQGGFFSKFSKFENAVKHRDWRTARAESSRTSGGKPLARRNLAVASLLSAAARKSSERYFISTDPKKAKSMKVVTLSGGLRKIKAP